jgi:hypothetical protein
LCKEEICNPGNWLNGRLNKRLSINNEWLSKLNEMLSQRQGDAKKQKSVGKRKI